MCMQIHTYGYFCFPSSLQFGKHLLKNFYCAFKWNCLNLGDFKNNTAKNCKTLYKIINTSLPPLPQTYFLSTDSHTWPNVSQYWTNPGLSVYNGVRTLFLSSIKNSMSLLCKKGYVLVLFWFGEKKNGILPGFCFLFCNSL